LIRGLPALDRVAGNGQYKALRPSEQSAKSKKVWTGITYVMTKLILSPEFRKYFHLLIKQNYDKRGNKPGARFSR